MKKTSVFLSLALLLAGSGFAPTATAESLANTTVTAFPKGAAAANKAGQDAAVDWYNNNGMPASGSQALLDQIEFARQNRIDAEPDSLNYYYWTGYQAQLESY